MVKKVYKKRLKMHVHPEHNAVLAKVLVTAINGGIESFLAAHGKKLPRELRGMMKGSLRKRILNQLLAEELRLRSTLTSGRSESTPPKSPIPSEGG